MPNRIRLVIADMTAALFVLCLPAVALAADGSAVMPERLAGVVATTLGIVLDMTHLLSSC